MNDVNYLRLNRIMGQMVGDLPPLPVGNLAHTTGKTSQVALEHSVSQSEASPQQKSAVTIQRYYRGYRDRIKVREKKNQNIVL